MKKSRWVIPLLVLLVSIVIGGGIWVIDYFALFQKSNIETGVISEEQHADTPGSEEKNESPEPQPSEMAYTVEEVAHGLYVPWSIVFTSADRMLVTERSGAIRVIQQGTLREEPLITFAEVSTQSEEGLMGMALDPHYDENTLVYVCLAYEKNGGMVDAVIQLKDMGNTINRVSTIVDDIPAAQYHAGCRLRFGPDGLLYISTGEATDKQIAQDTHSLGGKFLRVRTDGSIPADNPFPGSAVYTLGHRNPQGFDWDPRTGKLFSTEHGPSIFDGPAGGDEINEIKKGENYGWPIVSHDNSKEGLTSPLTTFTPAVAPASGMFYRSNVFPQFQNHFLFGALKGEDIIDVELNTEGESRVLAVEGFHLQLGRIRDVAESPDGLIYFSTSNRDDRGSVREGDDKIYRFVPQ